MGKEDIAVTFKNLNNSRMRTAHQFCQYALALLDWRAPQIFAVEFDQVESDPGPLGGALAGGQARLDNAQSWTGTLTQRHAWLLGRTAR